MPPKTAIIIGAGPAGLTAAYELLTRTEIKPVILEASGDIGGLSKTLNHHGNRIDLGGHRFFSKSERVRNWWLRFFPLETSLGGDQKARSQVMLIRSRHSRILFLRKLFDYPLSLSLTTIRNLGGKRLYDIITSYASARLHPIAPEKNLEDFFINRFGRELYQTFFKDYTEKVWGKPCREIQPEWGSQRVKGLSISKAVLHGLYKLLGFSGKKTETSLIESFWYPKYGPGQLWEAVADAIREQGGAIHLNHTVTALQLENERITSVQATDQEGCIQTFQADYVFSTMPVRDLVAAMTPSASVPKNILETAQHLEYRDFITVGILLKQLQLAPDQDGALIRDNWLYIQESDVSVGRIQIYNNWSPYLVSDSNTVWLGLEYFCNEGDAFWSNDDATIRALALQELETLGIARAEDFLEGVVMRVPKAYPAYWGAYEQFDDVKRFINGIDNLIAIGRNGMHKYNNADHSMLTAMTAVDLLIEGSANKEAIWQVNTEQDYHETIKPSKSGYTG